LPIPEPVQVMLDAPCIPQDPSTEGVCAAAGDCIVVLVLELDDAVEDLDEDSESDDEAELQLPNCGWHPVPQYVEEVPQ
jgi:hypothetical protein